MEIALDIIYIIAGIALVLWGADRMTDGAVSIAKRLRIPQMVIGLTIVALGTSMPELCISFVSALKGTSDLAVANVVGSNIFNTLLIVGIAALVAPIAIHRTTVTKDIPWSVFAGVLLIVLCLDSKISRLDAFILFTVFILFIAYNLWQAKKGKPEPSTEEEKVKENIPVWKSSFLVVLGLACLIFGSTIFVNSATDVAQALHVSDAVIGLTIVAGGTSLPELATSAVAAKKGQSAIAIGNVLGSNVYNILLILGLTGIVCPMETTDITMTDYGLMTLSMVLLWLFSFTRLKVERWEGAVLTIIFIAYTGWLIYNAVSPTAAQAILN